ncbi:alpha/beta hydrolase [Candidatus Uabimicrobium amorphum]|uniref:Alpha/beta hydrolase n=1 Tax=Uabimicrobium amorphum TaxID=2596890 RepID=A0A5S9ING8_UABAM|nr:alpha/beta hydrolase [Candidatus Uabimicrobium amorphum]BBM85138.1 alpha/beta hydrolase [Candidatus Uabimicrobium amorphum]
MSIFDTDAFNNNMFYPRRGSGREADEIWIEVESGVKIHARRYPNTQAEYSILYFHGNGEIVADYDTIQEMYRRIGCEFIVCDYRGYGKSGGTPTLRNLLSDSHKVYDYLQQENKLHDNHFIMGRSLGSAAAIELGVALTQICGVIVESGYADPIALAARRGIQLDRLSPEERIFDNGEKIREVTKPLLILHGKQDYIIRVEEAQENYTNAKATDKKLVVLEHVGHNDIMGAPNYFPAIEDFCHKHI